jgi:CheY-like chemotaxis protein
MAAPPKKRIITIDDDKSFNLILQKSFEKTPYDVISTTSAKDFFDKYFHGKYDLLIIDINIEDREGSGFKLLQLIRNKVNSHIPILVISKRSSETDISLALQNGANDFLAKPLDEVSLIQKVNFLLDVKNLHLYDIPLFTVPTIESKASFLLHLTIVEINEFFCIFRGPNYIVKGIPIVIYSKLFHEIFGEEEFSTHIHDSWVEKDGQFSISIAFNHETPENYLIANQVRKWLHQKYT